MLQAIKFRSLKPDVYADLIIPVTVDVTPTQPLFLRDITGIEPVTATINTKGYAQDGEYYMGSKIPKRSIVMKFGLNTSGGYPSVSAARYLIYGYAMTKNELWLEFFTDDHVPVQIRGYVESITPTRFSEDPELQVSVICPKPNLVTDEIEVRGNAGIDPDWTRFSYNGNRSTGIDFVLDMGTSDYVGSVILETAITEPTGVSPDVYQTFTIYDGTYFSADWQLWINTGLGTKYVDARTSPTNIVSNMLNLMDPNSWWMFLVPGLNWFRVRTPSDNSARGWSLKYSEQYGGI